MRFQMPPSLLGRAFLRLVSVSFGAFAIVCFVAHPQRSAFSVKDDIAMWRFSDPSAGKPGSLENSPKYSPDGKHFAIVTTRGDLTSDQIQSTITVFDTDVVAAFLRDTGHSGPLGRVVARIATIPHFEETVAYAPVIKDVRWSENGTHLYFRGEARNGAWALYDASLDGRPLRSLTDPSYNVDRFDIAGNVLVYAASRFGEDSTRQGRVINRDALDVTGSALIDILFPGQMPTYVPENYSLYVLRLTGGVATRVPGYRVSEISFLLYFLPFQLSPDGRRLLLTTPVETIPESWEKYDPPARFEHRRLAANDSTLTSAVNVLRPRVYSSVDLRTGKVTRLIDGPNAQNLGYYPSRNRAAWSSDGSRVLLTNVFLPLLPDGNVVTETSGSPCAVATVDLPMLTQRCLFFETRDPEDRAQDVDDVSFGNDSNEVRVFIKSGSSGRIERPYYLRNSRWELSENTPDRRIRGSAVPAGRTSDNAKNGIRVFIRESLNDPPTLWAADEHTGIRRELLDPNPQLRSLRFGAASVFQWKDSAGKEWTAGLIKPVGYIAGERYPLVIQMYNFDEEAFITDGTDPSAFAARELASVGFVVLQIRKKAVNLSEEDAQIHLEAYRSAIEALSKEGLIEPTKVGATGFSWTCWYVVNALVKSPQLFSAATIAEGFDNSYMQYMLFGPGPPNTRDQMEQVRGAAPFGSGLDRWVRDAPGFHLDQVRTPLRIEAMKPATVLNEWEVYAGLSLQHKPVDLIYFPAGTHIHQRPLERLESQQGNIDWMRFWLQGYEDPAPGKGPQYVLWEKLRSEPHRPGVMSEMH